MGGEINYNNLIRNLPLNGSTLIFNPEIIEDSELILMDEAMVPSLFNKIQKYQNDPFHCVGKKIVTGVNLFTPANFQDQLAFFYYFAKTHHLIC